VSFLGKLAEKAITKADEAMAKHGPSWVGKAVESGRSKVTELADQNLGPEGAVLAGKGLDWVEANKDRVAGIGYSGLTAVAGYVAQGDSRSAELIYLAQNADWAELDAAADGAAADVAAAAEAKSSLLDLGQDVAQVLFPILLALSPL
jgi:hypothetical protein